MHPPYRARRAHLRRRRHLLLAALLSGAVALASTPSLARQPADAYVAVPASADGIGKRYMGREIAQVMGWQGADWLDRAEREHEERPDLLLGALALKPGMTVADVGAGTGFYSWLLAARVGDAGRVYAVDVQPEMIALLEQQRQQRQVRNVIPLLATPQDTRLAPGSIDLALMVDVYHELAFPREVLDSIVRALKPGGRVVFVEYRAKDPAVPIKRLHKMSEAQVRKEATVRGLEWTGTFGGLPWQHVVNFRKP